MRTDSNMENIKFLLDSMELNETYMDNPKNYVPVFEMMFLYAPKKNVALYTLLDMIKAKLDMIRIEEGTEKDIDGEA